MSGRFFFGEKEVGVGKRRADSNRDERRDERQEQAILRVNDNDQYADALERCETAARRHGHVLSVWQRVDERLHASLCKACGAMAVVARPAHEELWRAGGTASKQTCLLGRGSKRGSKRRYLISGIPL
jgi:hypothetical protein